MMIQHVEWRQPGKNYDPDVASLETATDFTGLESMTIQSAAAETDINNIVRKYGLTGELPVRRQLAEYGEFDDSMDFMTLLSTLRSAEDAFYGVPADVRARFDNDPGAFMEWIHAPANFAEAMELGLLEPPEGYVKPGVVVPSTPSAAVVQAAAVRAADAGEGAGSPAV